MSPRYLTPAELSARFEGRISIRTLSNWRCNGTGPEYTKVGGRILYPVSAVETWERGRTVRSTSQYRPDGEDADSLSSG